MENHGLNTQLLERFLKNRFHNEKLADIISVEVENAVPKGTNFSSSVYRARLTGLTAAGRTKTFSMIVKTELKAEASNEILRPFQVFSVETRIYTTILPMMEDLMTEVEDKREKFWPELLGFQPYTLMAFDDLSEKGYVCTPRKNTLDFNHARLVLRNIARFHAMSKVLLARGLLTTEERGRLSIGVDNPMFRKGWNLLITVLADAMVNNWGIEWAGISDKLRNLMDEIALRVCALADNFDNRFEVLNHGDLWTCNTLFKYMEDEDNFPIGVKFVDYQNCHVNSFIWDVVQFLFSSTVPSVRRSRLDELLGAYHNSLERNLKILNYNGYVPTLNDLKSEWERIEFAQLCYCITHALLKAEAAKPFDMEKINTHAPNEVLDKKVFTDGGTMNAIGEDLKNLSVRGII